MKAAIYIRVSTTEQATQGYGQESQLSMCEAYCKAFGLEIVQTYYDSGVSGTKPLTEREGLNSLLSDIPTKGIETIVTASLDRIGRKSSIVLSIWDLLDKMGIAIVTVKERIDTSTPSGKLHRTMLAAIAEFERDNIVQRTTDGRNERAKIDGDKGGKVPFGYDRIIQTLSNIVINEEQSKVVQKIFDLHSTGLSLNKIAAYLTNEGIPTPKNGKKWYAKTVSIILSQEPIYKGSNRGDSEYQYPVILEGERGQNNDR